MGKSDEYKTGLRQLFEVVRYGGDKKELQKIFLGEGIILQHPVFFDVEK